MSSPRFRVEWLDGSLDRSGFDCGTPALDHYFHAQVMQDIKRRMATCFVARGEAGEIAGYYTLSAASVMLTQLPALVVKKLPRYPSVPVVRMGRLAVDRRFKGLGLGAALLFDALSRTARSDIAAYALLVDAKDEAAAAFYRHHGFMAFEQQALTLYLPLATVRGI